MLVMERNDSNYVAKNVAPKNNERLNPLNDYLFKQYMGTEECKPCLISFLNAVLDEDIKDVEILHGYELAKETRKGKFGRLDILALLSNGDKINVEVQLQNKYNIVKRSQYYNSRLFVSSIIGGEDYSKLKKVISINILGFDYFDYPDFYISGRLRVDQYPEYTLSDLQEFHFIELPKFYKLKNKDMDNPLYRWLMFFDKDINEDLLKELIEMDEGIKKAEDRIQTIARLEELSYYWAIEDAERDMISAQIYHMEKGLAEGRTEGEKAMSELIERLSEDNRITDIIKVAKDVEYRKELYKEYNIISD